MKRFSPPTVVLLGMGILGCFLAGQRGPSSGAKEQPPKEAMAPQLFVRLLGTSA